MSDLLFQRYDDDSVLTNSSVSFDRFAASENDTVSQSGTTEHGLSDLVMPTGAEFALPEHACSYCNIHSVDSVVKCNTCNKWFCNSISVGNASDIVTHLTISKHKTVSLHPDSELGDTTLECYSCGNRNIFNLGYVSAKEDQVVVILCRVPCALSKNTSWDTSKWRPLIEEKQFLEWIATVPHEDELINARPITHESIRKLENQWLLNRDVNINDLEEEEVVEDENILPTLTRYNDAYQYQQSFAPLINLEALYDKNLKESQALEHIAITWSTGHGNNALASFTLSTFEKSELKVAVGDEIVLRYNGGEQEPWEGTGQITRLPNAHQEEFTLELFRSDAAVPTHLTTGFTAEFLWKGITYERMQEALRIFAIDEKSVSSFIYHKILGHEVKPIEFDVEIPTNLSLPKFGELNSSQYNAVRAVLKRPFSLIQGPPGTGKTVTSATIIYHLSHMSNDQKILVCAPSNVAVDHLAEKLDLLGLKVVKVTARSRQDVETSPTDHLSLHARLLAASKNKGQMYSLLKQQAAGKGLKPKESKKLHKYVKKAEHEILNGAKIVCCTCVAAGDKRLARYQFRTVLIDESTQAAEPETLIPIVKGSKQVILVGDHQQLGPVILDRKAGDCGLKQSLFERLIVLGHVPIRLEVQYRMNPVLSEFPSNMFYEGSLQDGVTVEDRLIKGSFPWPVKDSPMFFWGNYGKEEISGSGSSFLNRVEAMNVEKVVTRLFKDGVKPEQIGVITPYEGQRAFITQYMALNSSILERKADYLNIEITSVDAFQGREKDFIILSCVRANQAQSIGFLRDPRRLNVAITRAKFGLIILGNPKSLCKNFLWNQLLLHFREKGCLVEGPLENLTLSAVQLNQFQQRKLDANPSKVGQKTESLYTDMNSFDSGNFKSASSLESEKWPALTKEYYTGENHINSNFYTKLNKLNQMYKQGHSGHKAADDDIKSITSSFIAGFNLN